MTPFVTIAGIATLGAMSPGPDFVVVAKYALMHDRRTALMSSLGIALGILFHTVYCVLGLALIISQSLLLFSLIKYLGAAYLIYLGLKSFFSKTELAPSFEKSMSSVNTWLAFRDGFLTNVLNPKCTLFMLSVFTLVIEPSTAHWIQFSFGLEIALIACLWFAFLSVGLTVPSIKSKIDTVQNMVGKILGAALVGLGLWVAVK